MKFVLAHGSLQIAARLSIFADISHEDFNKLVSDIADLLDEKVRSEISCHYFTS
jgi:hypothetical protein